jgi:HD superfamily phosphohydrolase
VVNFQDLFERLKKTFEIACLLHDVGHAPFSHTFEQYFLQKRDNKSINDSGDKSINEIDSKSIVDIILSGESSESSDDAVSIVHAGKREKECALFCKDYKLLLSSSTSTPTPTPTPTSTPKPHERTSAILVLSEYFESICEQPFCVDPYLVARMIIGMPYSESDSRENRECQVANLFVSLLNGKTLDVDKLDYLARDQWACGRVAKNVDYERLLSSLYVYCEPSQQKLDICYHKRAISEILVLEQVKKTISTTIHHHHLIKYDTYVLKKAIEEIAGILGKANNRTSDDIIGNIISLQAIRKEKSAKAGRYTFRLLTDDDLIHIMKTFLDESEYAQEWFYRAYKLKPVWKTSADYNYFFGKLSNKEQIMLHEKIKSIIGAFFREKGLFLEGRERFHIEDKLDNEYNYIATPDINILIKNNIVKLNKVTSLDDTGQTMVEKGKRGGFFLLYIPKELMCHRDELIEYIVRQVQESTTNSSIEH